MRAFLGLLILAAVSAPLAARAEPPPLVVDLSRHLVPITTGFAGQEVLIFGASDELGGDVVIQITGPRRDEVVRHKRKVGGIWINDSSVTFVNVPAFYGLASSRPLAEIASAETLAGNRIGTQFLDMPALETNDPGAIEDFRRGLIRNMERRALFPAAPDRVINLGNRLFRTAIHLPSNVPTGVYRVEALLFRDGQLVNRQMTPLAVRKVGIEAEIYNFAHRQSLAYGLLAVVIAVAAGWLAGVIFRKA